MPLNLVAKMAIVAVIHDEEEKEKIIIIIVIAEIEIDKTATAVATTKLINKVVKNFKNKTVNKTTDRLINL